MADLHAAVVGFDITPPIHPEYGAWGTTPKLKRVDMPLLSRCVALEQDGRRLLWFGSDLCGNAVWETDAMRAEVAEALNFDAEQIIWSTSQTHSSPTLPGSDLCGGSSITERGTYDEQYTAEQRRLFMSAFKEAGREALDRLQPVRVFAGKGFCDSMSYNTRFPMPTGGVKFSRHHLEGLQSGKYYDPTIGLVRFEDRQGNVLGAIFNFCCHPATMIDGDVVSPDWVGTARNHVEEAIGGAPAMFVQGFCGDVNCHHIFGTPALAKRSGDRLGKAAARAIPRMVPVSGEPFVSAWKTIDLQCRPMYTGEELEREIDGRLAFIEELKVDPTATWFCGINFPEQLTAEQRAQAARIHLDYLEEGLRLLESGEPVRQQLQLRLGAVRIGDVGAVISPGENFTRTGARARERSPLAHTLVCGDSNGLFGYIGDDVEIDRGGYETNSYWKYAFTDGYRLAPAKGTVDRILNALDELTEQVTGA